MIRTRLIFIYFCLETNQNNIEELHFVSLQKRKKQSAQKVIWTSITMATVKPLKHWGQPYFILSLTVTHICLLTKNTFNKEYTALYLVNELINDVPQPLVWQLKRCRAISICLQTQMFSHNSSFTSCNLTLR